MKALAVFVGALALAVVLARNRAEAVSYRPESNYDDEPDYDDDGLYRAEAKIDRRAYVVRIGGPWGGRRTQSF